MIFWIGTKLHETPISDLHETSLEWNGIHGTVDEYYHDGYIVDKKSCRSMPRRPYSNHVKQIEYYAILALNNGYEVKGGYMLYIFLGNKEEKPKAESFPVRMRDAEVVEAEMIDKLIEFNEALDTDVPPKRKVGWNCQYCDFNIECFGGG
jgi:CRISPR/Cas system-associated exonuclease Cas4 (RecB family)